MMMLSSRFDFTFGKPVTAVSAMMALTVPLLVSLLLLSLVPAAQAQLRIEITEGQVAPTPIAIADFTGLDGTPTDEGRQIATIISNDLLSSGLFEPIDTAAFIAPPTSPKIKPNFANWSPLVPRGCLSSQRRLTVKASCRLNSCCGMW